MELTKEAAIIEAILFLENDPINKRVISRISGLAANIVEVALSEIIERYNNPQHGIEVIEISEGYSFSPKEEFWGTLKEHYGKKNEDKLSNREGERLENPIGENKIGIGYQPEFLEIQTDNRHSYIKIKLR